MGILHRDVKPGNFMLLNDSVRAPLKAIGEEGAGVGGSGAGLALVQGEGEQEAAACE